MKTFLIVDVQSLYRKAFKKYNGKLNFEKFITHIKEKYGDIARIVAYGNQHEIEVAKFINVLKFLGFETNYRASRTQIAAISVDVFKMLGKIEKYIFASSDPDLIPLIDFLRENGHQVQIISFYIPHDLKYYLHEELTEELIEKRNNFDDTMKEANELRKL